LRNATYTSFHSGGHVIREDEEVLEKHTTNVEELERIAANCGRSHITFSSYDSFTKLVDIEFDLIIFDEAHNLMQDQFRSIIEELMKYRELLILFTLSQMHSHIRQVK